MVSIEPKQVALNILAGCVPVRNRLRRLRDRRRPPDYEQIVSYTIDRLRVRTEFIGDDRIQNATILEIGSGIEFGLALLLLAVGARRIVNIDIDPYGYVLDSRFYRLLVDRASAEGIPISWPPRGVLVDSNERTVSPDPESVALHLGWSAEAVPEPDGSIDVTFSVAVLEHIRARAMLPVARELYRLTRPGGIGYHRIDLADHYHRRSEPFRFLRYKRWEYSMMYGNRGSSSNRMRMGEIERIYQKAGFESVVFDDVQLYEDVEQFSLWGGEFDAEFQGQDPDLMRALQCMLVIGR